MLFFINSQEFSPAAGHYIVPCAIRDTSTEILDGKNYCRFLARPMDNMKCSTASIDLYVGFSENMVAKDLP